MQPITVADVRRCFAAHLPLYSWREPIYQYVALSSLQQLWDAGHRSALDVGGGTGVMAYAIKALFGLERVSSVDIEDRFRPGLGIETAVYDGATLPFADGSFDCVVLFNMLHHVPVTARATLLRECRRVAGRGPLYIKDHLSSGWGDDRRLAMLDFLGNVPFGGMVWASYLREGDWRGLAAQTGHEASAPLSGRYRRGAMAALFPNRLEVSMRWRPL
jgi:ubiquinone/menaquinone biosynthesis C-methylase UbiE